MGLLGRTEGEDAEVGFMHGENHDEFVQVVEFFEIKCCEAIRVKNFREILLELVICARVKNELIRIRLVKGEIMELF